MKSTLSIVAVAGLALGCATAGQPPASTAPAPLDPVGGYALSADFQGQSVDGRLRITGSPGAYGGRLYTDLTGELPLSAVTVDGEDLRVTADTPDGPIVLRLTVSGESVTGNWSLGAEGGAVHGQRVPG